MRPIRSVALGAALLTVCIAGRLAAQGQTQPAAPQGQPPAQAPTQTPPAQAPPPQTPGPQGQGGRGGRGQIATFPAQQRPPGDAALIARGKSLFEVNCRLCHGADLRGGDMGGVNLLRSALVLSDQHGELIVPVVHTGRANPGMPVMPPFPQLTDDDVKAIAEYIHSVAATMRGQGNPPPGAEATVLNIVVGDPAAGKTYFEEKCASCHSTTGDLAGIASRYSEPVQLQNAWVAGGGGGGGRGGRGGGRGSRTQATVTVTTPQGQPVEGRLDRIDDFIVVLTPADGVQRSFQRVGDVPRVEIHDPLAEHRKLLSVYRDKDIHDVTAYLVTVK
jgi:cytochrome c oxidase cbb3-type subunit III